MAVRHWKQRYDPDAKFVFLKRLKLGLNVKKPWVLPGDPVPTGDVRLGRGRLKRWWEAGIIGLADFVDPDVVKRDKRKQDAHEVREALAAAAKVLPGLLAQAEELKTAKEPEEAALAELERDLLSMRALLERAKFLGVGVESEALAALAGVEIAEPVPLEPVTTETIEPKEGPTITVVEGGFEVSMPDGSLASVGTMEEAAHFVKTGELPEAPESPAEGSEGEGDAEGPPVDEVVVEETGGGWYTVTVPGEDEPRKVQGKEALDALLAELGATE